MHGRWISAAARVYYLAGALYYLYKWLLVTGSGGLVLSALAYISTFPYIVYSVAPLSLFMLAWGGLLAAKKKTIRLQSHNPSLEEKFLESIYTVLGNNQYRYLRRVIIKALHDDVDHYQHKFSWSGTANVGDIDSVMQAPYMASVIRVRNSPSLLCRIQLDRPLRKGEERDLTYSLTLTDTAETAQLFLGHAGYSPIKGLILRINPAAGSNIRTYKRQLFASHTADIPIFEEEVTVPTTSPELWWNIGRPRLGYLYRIAPN